MIVITGGAGFIGSNLVKTLNDRGRSDLVVIDDMRDGHKFRNLVDCEILDLIDKDAVLEQIESGAAPRPEVVFHLGACSDTMEWDGRVMLGTNYTYSKALLAFCAEHEVPLIYASSAAVYGRGPVFREERPYERPLNMYAYSKLLFDQHVRRTQLSGQLVGLRYFNVYGPREAHKGEMASVAYKFHRQLVESDRVRLFRGSDGYAAGEHRRDFIWVGDAVRVTLWFWEHPEQSGIFNVGTGQAQTFNDVVRAVIAYHGHGEIEYIDFPDPLRGRYQSFTQADISALRKAGYDAPFLTVEEAVPLYLKWLEGQELARDPRG